MLGRQLLGKRVNTPLKVLASIVFYGNRCCRRLLEFFSGAAER